MAMTDWKAALAGLDLPQGETPAPGPEAQPARQPKPRHLTVRYEKKGRSGKPATILSGFPTPEAAAEAASALKRTLGIGGSARDDEVLLQGDCRPRLAAALAPLGYKL